MKLRSLQPMFQVAATRWILRLGQKLAPLQASRGGPILAVQVEKEYGSFGDDHDYMKWVLEVVIRAGLGGPCSTRETAPTCCRMAVCRIYRRPSTLAQATRSARPNCSRTLHCRCGTR